MTSSVAIPAPFTLRWNTLRLLTAGRTAILVADLLLLIAAIAGTHAHRAAMQTIGKDSAPSIIAAQRIRSALAEMDADEANELITPAGMATPAAAAYERHRIEAAQALIEAAANITYGDSERLPIETLQVSMGTYERLIQEAEDLNDAGQHEAAVRYFWGAGFILDGTLLPAADLLDTANNSILERTYRNVAFSALAWRTCILLLGLLATALAAAAQFFLFRRMHRLLNPLLLIATVLTLGLTLYTFTTLGREEHDLKVAKEDAFTSVRALSRARASAFSAYSKETRSVLDRLHAADYERDFAANANALACLPPVMPVSRVLRDAKSGSVTPGFTGYLADELNNITFPGERDAAVETLATFEDYLSTDARMRDLVRKGKTNDAIDVAIGTAEGQSARDYNQFDRALVRTLDINRQAFTVSVDNGLSVLRGLEWKASVTGGCMAILTLLGFAPRIREYV
jgi:hypothetical protein